MAIQSQGWCQVQKQTQNLVLASQLRQSLKILQVPALNQDPLSSRNCRPTRFWKKSGSNDESLDAEVPESSPEESKDTEQEEFPDDPAETKQDSENENLEPGMEDTGRKEDLARYGFLRRICRPQGNGGRSARTLREEYEGEAKLGNSDAAEKRKFFFDSLVAETSLQEHLLDQLKLVVITKGQRQACEYMIGS